MLARSPRRGLWPPAFLFFLALSAGCTPADQEPPAATADAEVPAADAGAESPQPPDPADAGGLVGTSWRLLEIAGMDDSVDRPDDPALYTLEFAADGTAQLRADCNHANGSWTSESPGQLRFGPLAATRAACPPGSLHDRYLAQFEWVRSYLLKDGHLFLATMADGSIIEFEPVPEAPLAATVLGEEIRTSDVDEMRQIIVTRLFERYAASHGIKATEPEIDALVEHLDRVATEDRLDREQRLAEIDRRLSADRLSDDERASLTAERSRQAEFLAGLESTADRTPEEVARIRDMRRGMGRSVIRQWKLNRALYEQYGGRIIGQQFGPEPLDAYREFLEEQAVTGAFVIHKARLEPQFWSYFTDDTRHSFMDPGSAEAGGVFATPPWQRD